MAQEALKLGYPPAGQVLSRWGGDRGGFRFLYRHLINHPKRFRTLEQILDVSCRKGGLSNHRFCQCFRKQPLSPLRNLAQALSANLEQRQAVQAQSLSRGAFGHDGEHLIPPFCAHHVHGRHYGHDEPR